MDNEQAAHLATGYVWGCQDGSGTGADSAESWYFSGAYRARNHAYRSERTATMIPVADAWRQWTTQSRLTYHTRDGWREIVRNPASVPSVLDRPTDTPPAPHLGDFTPGDRSPLRASTR